VSLLSALRVGSVRLTLVSLDVRRRGTEFVEVPVRSALNPPESTGMPFWSLNPYVGCEFGCAYCYARFAHDYRIERSVAAGQLPASTKARLSTLERPWLAFEHAILVKRRREFVAALARDLERVRRRAVQAPQSIAIGTATDPYQPAERSFGLTRAALEHLVQWSDPRRGRVPPRLQLSVVTKSGLVTRDADLLRALTRRHHVGVYLSVITLDARIIRLVEPRSPLPRVRIRAMRRLATAGVPVGVFCAPVLPGLTDDLASLRRLLQTAKAAGARFAAGAAVRISRGTWAPLAHALARSRPALLTAYRRRYASGAYAPARYRDALERRFEKLRAEMGLERSPFPDAEMPNAVQLSLWEPAGRPTGGPKPIDQAPRTIAAGIGASNRSAGNLTSPPELSQ
jgi:DNA repair photolyase